MSASAPSRFRHLLNVLGPGILFASTCIGVSHLVQSTRAGADFGWALLGFVVLANVMKYPFFEFTMRYTAATGQSILRGYRQRSKAILWVYFGITVVSMFTVTAAVTFVTAGLLDNLLGLSLLWPGLNLAWVSAIVFAVIVVILGLGQFNVLDNLLKVVASVLLISTVAAFVMALFVPRPTMEPGFVAPDIWAPASMVFIIALMGWMPTAIDIGTWNSIWAVEKIRVSGYRPTLREARLDFNLGYVISAVLAVVFMGMGALIIYGTGTELSDKSTVFAGQIVNIYTTVLGDGFYWVIAIAAFSTMFSTSITVLDGYTRAFSETMLLLTHSQRDRVPQRFYNVVMVVVALVSMGIIAFFAGQLRALIDLATIISFVLAPAAAYINYLVVTDKTTIGEGFRLSGFMKLWSWAGMLFLLAFTVWYVVILL